MGIFAAARTGSGDALRYAGIWDLYQGQQPGRARAVFSKRLLLINLEEQVPGGIEFSFEALGAYLRA